MNSEWSWQQGALSLGLVFFMAVFLVKPIGVSTQFVILDGIIWSAFDASLIEENTESKSGYGSSNAYLDKSGGKYAKSVANPLNYSFVFVLSMVAGAYLSMRLRRYPYDTMALQAPELWRENFGDNLVKRYVSTFFGGFLVLFGARLAGGCTSGHMMSGIMQTALSGYLFALATFSVGVPIAIWLYRKA